MRSLAHYWGLSGLLVAGLTIPLIGRVFAHELENVYWLGLSGTAVAVVAWLWPRPLLALSQRVAHLFALAPWQPIWLALALPLAILAHMANGDGLLAHAFWLMLACWVGSMTAVLVGGWAGGMAWPRRWDAPDWTAVLFLLGLALAVRVVGLETMPTTLSGDEGSAGLAAVRLGTGLESNWLGPSWYSFPALHFVVQYLGIAWWGQTIFGLRFMSAVAGALTVPALYGLLREMYGRPTAIAGASYLVASHYHIHFSRIGLNNIWDGLFTAVVLAALWCGWQTADRRWYLLGGLALGLAQYFYVSIRLLPLFILLWAGLLWLAPSSRGRLRQQFPHLVLMAYTSLITFLPLGLYFSDKLDQFMAPINRVTIWGDWLATEMAGRGQTATAVVLNQIRLSALGLVSEPLRHWYTPGIGVLSPWAAGLFGLGVLLILWRRRPEGWLLLVTLGGHVLFNAFSQDAPAAQRYIIASVIATAVVAIPLGAAYEAVVRRWPRWPQVAQAGLGLVLLGLMGWNLHFYFVEVPHFFVLGGENTEVATAVAVYLRDFPEKPPFVYFIGPPRMGYRSHATIPYLVPEGDGMDIWDPLTEPPDWFIPRPSVFIFLPERQMEYGYVFQSFPGGRYREFRNERGQLLFTAYEVR